MEYEYAFVDPDQEYLCSICHCILRDPHLTDCCGQHFCERCLNEWFRQEGRAICPHCRNTRFNHIRDLPLKRKIDGFRVFCSNKGQGCQDVSTVGELSSHLGECQYSCVTCGQCLRNVLRKYLSFHLQHECPKRVVNCWHCGTAGEYDFITSERHQVECPDYPVGCPRKCENSQRVRRKELKSHADVCPLEPVRCRDCKCDLLRRQLAHHSENECQYRLVRCPYCNRQGTYKDFTPHIKICEEAPVDCPNKCGQDLKRKQLACHRQQICPLEPTVCGMCRADLVRREMFSHCQSYCPKRIVPCGYCYQGIPHDEMQLHVQEVCGEYPVGCPRKCNKGAEQLKRKNLARHAEICPIEPVKCPYYEVGCETEVIRQELSFHMTSYTAQHLAKLTEAHEKQSDELKRTRQLYVKLRDEYAKSTSRLHYITSSLSLEANWIKMQNPCGEFAQSYRCLKSIVDPKLVDDGDALAFRVPSISHSWTSPPFYLLSGYKLQITFSLRFEGIVASLELLKGENDGQLKWPIEEEYNIVLKVTVERQQLPSDDDDNDSGNQWPQLPPRHAPIETVKLTGVPLYRCSGCAHLHHKSQLINQLVMKDKHMLGYIVVAHNGPWVAEVSLSKHAHECANCHKNIPPTSWSNSMCHSCQERARTERYEREIYGHENYDNMDQ